MNLTFRRVAVFTSLVAIAAAQRAAAPDDVMLRVMKDEIDRSRQLRVVGLDERPYFIEYAIEDVDSYAVSAMLGALLNSSRNHGRVPQVTVRAGDYAFDDTNHVFTGRYSGSRYDPDQWPIDDNYAALRHNFWLATDRAYKTALESMARKRASLRNAASPDKTPDFAKAEPTVLILPVNKTPIDESIWKKRAIDFSTIFLGYPEIYTSSVDASVFVGTAYLVNSEGSVQRTPDTLVQLRAQAQTQAADGMPIHDARVFQSDAVNGLASEAELRKGITEVADNIRALVKAPAGEGYSGPVLFEGKAAGQLMAQLLGENLKLTRRPVSDPGRPAQSMQSELESKVGSRILPDWINVADDPTQTQFRGEKLIGTYPFDMEGIKPKPLAVVEKGVLKEFLLTRQPVNTYAASNGRARLMGNYGAHTAAISNLFISATETKPLADLKKQLIDLCKQRNKPYGMLVRKLDYPSSASVADLQSIIGGAMRNGTARPITPPILVYKVYPDGREELVRGLHFRGLNARSMRDIVAASAETSVFHFLNNGAPFAFLGLGGFLAPASVVSPSLLFEEVEFEKPQDELSKPPLVAPPPIESAAAKSR